MYVREIYIKNQTSHFREITWVSFEFLLNFLEIDVLFWHEVQLWDAASQKPYLQSL